MGFQAEAVEQCAQNLGDDNEDVTVSNLLKALVEAERATSDAAAAAAASEHPACSHGGKGLLLGSHCRALSLAHFAALASLRGDGLTRVRPGLRSPPGYGRC
jgi:hypothetical protein